MSGRWVRWGVGPTGVSGGPSKVFLLIALAGCAIAAALLARDGRLAAAGIAAAAAVYFALRAFAGLGRKR